MSNEGSDREKKKRPEDDRKTHIWDIDVISKSGDPVPEGLRHLRKKHDEK